MVLGRYLMVEYLDRYKKVLNVGCHMSADVGEEGNAKADGYGCEYETSRVQGNCGMLRTDARRYLHRHPKRVQIYYHDYGTEAEKKYLVWLLGPMMRFFT